MNHSGGSQQWRDPGDPLISTTGSGRCGFVTYDELPGAGPRRRNPARLPLPMGGEHVPLDPDAELAVGEGEVRVTIRDGRSRSLDGQGMTARWRRFRGRGIEA